jgi:hypothetical protein
LSFFPVAVVPSPAPEGCGRYFRRGRQFHGLPDEGLEIEL